MKRPRRIIFNLSLRATLCLGALTGGAALVIAARASLPAAANDAGSREWRSFGGDPGGARSRRSRRLRTRSPPTRCRNRA